MNKKYQQVLLHVLGCLAFLSLPVIFSPDFSGSFYFLKVPFFQKDVVNYIVLILCFYFNFYLLIPKFYFNRKYFLFVLGILLSFAALIYVPEFVFKEFLFKGDEIPHMNKFSPPKGNFILREIRHHLFQFMAVFIFSFFMKIYARLKKAEKEKSSAEISYLKSQINPHFLFNTLNSIYSLALEKSDSTAPAVVKLSGMMRYVISEADHDYVPLEKEIEYIDDYIDLQKIRWADTVKIAYTKSISLDGMKIAPLLLIPFIENAFKYGVNAEENSAIQIRIRAKEGKLSLEVYNNIISVKNVDVNSGLGIENTKQRLQLLYPGKHELTIINNADRFSVFLILTLK
jgi:hypothetical protein